MESITLSGHLKSDVLVIPADVADRMISEANEVQLKIYLYLLRMGSDKEVTISSIADYFNYTESDVSRALRFINGIDVTDEKSIGNDNVKSEAVAGDKVVAFSVRPTYSRDKLTEFASIPEISQLMFVAEQYMARPLKPDDISSMLYMYDEMKFSADLIEYLLEYCISNNRKSMRSIESVAAEWKEAGIDSVAAAKKMTRTVPKQMTDVLIAFGLDKSRQPVDAEIAYVRKWTESFGYDMDIISQACQRTILAINKPNFRYANTILKGWHDAGVKTVADILAADENYHQSRSEMTQIPVKGRAGRSNTTDVKNIQNIQNKNTVGSAGKFRNFSEREYDYDSLMNDILSN